MSQTNPDVDFGPLFREVLLSDTKPIPVYETVSDSNHISDIYRNVPKPVNQRSEPDTAFPEVDYGTEILNNFNNVHFNQHLENSERISTFSNNLPDLSDIIQLDGVSW